MDNVQDEVAALLETTTTLMAHLTAANFQPGQVSMWLVLLQAVIDAWHELYSRLDHADEVEQVNTLLYEIASAIRYGNQPPTQELERLLASIGTSGIK